jgi:hypothetical protein
VGLFCWVLKRKTFIAIVTIGERAHNHYPPPPIRERLNQHLQWYLHLLEWGLSDAMFNSRDVKCHYMNLQYNQTSILKKLQIFLQKFAQILFFGYHYWIGYYIMASTLFQAPVWKLLFLQYFFCKWIFLVFLGVVDAITHEL